MQTDLSTATNDFHDSAFKVLRILTAQWADVYETLSQSDRDSLLLLVACGFAKCRADIHVSRKRILGTREFRFLCEFSGGGRHAKGLLDKFIKNETGASTGDPFDVGSNVWQFCITAEGEGAREWIESTPSLVRYQIEHGEPPFTCFKVSTERYEAEKRNSTAVAAAQAIASNVNNIQVNVAPSPAPVVNIVMPSAHPTTDSEQFRGAETAPQVAENSATQRADPVAVATILQGLVSADESVKRLSLRELADRVSEISKTSCSPNTIKKARKILGWDSVEPRRGRHRTIPSSAIAETHSGKPGDDPEVMSIAEAANAIMKELPESIERDKLIEQLIHQQTTPSAAVEVARMAKKQERSRCARTDKTRKHS